MSAFADIRPGETPLAVFNIPAEGSDQWLRELAEKINESGHSAFSPSGSAMWLSCSGSLIANMMEPDSCSYEAAEGTVAHEIAEQWLRTKQAQYHRVGDVVKDEIFGAMAVFTEERRTATVIASEPCTVMVIPKDQFLSLMRSNPRIAHSLIESMARRIDLMNKEITSLRSKLKP